MFEDEPSVVIAAVDCDAHGSLAEKYEVKGFPTLKFFGKEESAPEEYEGGRQLEDFVTFINEKAGLDFAVDGGVVPSGGVVEEISEHIKSYISASTAEEREKVMDSCKEEVGKLNSMAQGNFKYYSKVFAKIAEKGIEYVKAERERLSKVLETSASLKPVQKRSFQRRVNVLSTFDEL